VGGDVRLLRFAGVQPPLAGERDHADQHLAYIGAFFGSRPRRLNSSARMCSTRVATSLRIEMNDPVDDPTGESRTRIPETVGVVLDVVEQSERGLLDQLVRAAAVSAPVTPSSSARTSRSTTTAYRPSLPPKCSYTTGLETSARFAISSTEVPRTPSARTGRGRW